jgi:transmembrane sensor
MTMKSEHEVNDELIAKYLSGEATPEEAMAMVDWLQLPANKIRFEQLEKPWNASARQTRPTFSSEKAWSCMEGSITSLKRSKPSVKPTWWTSNAFRIAASLLFVTATAVVIVLNFRDDERNSILATQREIASVTLPDSSKITLFRFSAIEYPQEFNKRTREVSFAKGEAFFRVARNAEKPFVIHTPTANIKVVGTEFNVKVEGNQTEVAVKEGKVLVYSSSDSILLIAGSNAIFRPDAKANVTNDVVDTNVWSYATRKLTFKDAPLGSVIVDLQRVYPCTISIANLEISHCKLTATFENDSVDKIINLIAETLSLEVKKNGDTFILVGEGCP